MTNEQMESYHNELLEGTKDELRSTIYDLREALDNLESATCGRELDDALYSLIEAVRGIDIAGEIEELTKIESILETEN